MSSKEIFDKEPKTTINPYRQATGLILSRMLWDMHLYSWISRNRIKGWRDKYLGQKAVILCNGPSLNKVNFNLLEKSGTFKFGLNKINLLFNRVKFRPSVIVAVNLHVLEQNADFYNKTNIPLFLDSSGKKYVKFRKNINFLHSTGKGLFARDCSISICQGHTVTYVAMQLAFHMGFKDVALVGCDHSFDSKGPANKTIIAGDEDASHFDKNYFAGGVKWQLPDIVQSELHYKIAKDIYELNNRNIYNSTEGGKLEVYERKSLEDFLNL